MYATRQLGPQPGPRRLIDAVQSTAAKVKTTERAFGWRESLIRGQQKVAEHYRNLLARHQLSQYELDDILSRIACIEAELDQLISDGNSLRPNRSSACLSDFGEFTMTSTMNKNAERVAAIHGQGGP